MEKCGHTANNRACVRVSVPRQLGAYTEFPGALASVVSMPVERREEAGLPLIVVSSLCGMAGPDTESQKSDASSIRSWGPGPGHQSSGAGRCLRGLLPRLWMGRCGERGTPAGTVSHPPVPRVSHQLLLPVQVDRSSHVDRQPLRSRVVRRRHSRP